VIAVVPDLFFAAKITAVAKAAGVEVRFVSLPEALPRCRDDAPDLVLLDLHAPGDVPALVRALRADPATRPLAVVGFYSHVESATRAAALEAGVDRALPRSAFVSRLPALLAGTDGTAERPE
jgi:CheY-like chemotaxis protein